MLTLDGVNVGIVKSSTGGGAAADVVSEPAGPSFFSKKHISAPKYEAMTMQVGLSMSKAFYDWITACWKGNFQSKNGSILACDSNFNILSQRDFFNALLTEVTIPAMDGSSKDAAYMTLKFSPEYTRYKKSSGKVTGIDTRQKLWLPSNFRLNIPSLDCTRVSKIEALTIQRTAGNISFPNLKITLAELTAQTWIDWHDTFVIKGNSGDANEKTGSLVFLAPDLQTPLGGITFYNLGIFRLSLDSSDITLDQVQHVTAELYCERMEFQYGSNPA